MSDDIKAWHAFSGGEISEELFGRTDLQDYNIALAKCLNWTVLPHGPVTTDAGTQFILCSKASGQARLIPFIRGNGESLVLELGEHYIRFHRDGGTVLSGAAEKDIELISVIPATSPVRHQFKITAHGYSNGNSLVVYGITRNGKPVATGGAYTVSNAATDTFELLNASGQPIFGTDTDTSINNLYDGGDVALSSAAIYEIATPYLKDELFDLDYEQSVDTITFSHFNWRSRELVRNADNDWDFSVVVHQSAIGPPASAPTVAAVGSTGASIAYRYVVTAVDEKDEESIASGIGGASNDLTQVGQYNTVVWAAVTGARYYNVYKEWAASGRFFFLMSSTDHVSGIADDNITPDFTKAPPEATDPFGAIDGTTTLPSTVSYHQQRRFFGSTLGDPQRFWATRSGSDYNMNASIVPQDDDPFNFRLASRRAHTIRHIVPMSDLLMLTGSAIWRVFPDSSGNALTPTGTNTKESVSVGSSKVRPSAFREYLLFANARGEHLTAVNFSQEAGGYVPRDLSKIAPHLIDGMSWVQMDFQESPYQIWWGVRSDGVLIGMTFDPEQNLTAWHQHKPGGTNVFVESIAIVPANDSPTDLIYLVVRRTVNGLTKRFIEFMKPRAFTDLAHSFCVSAGLMYDGAYITTVTGLSHLEGQTVAVLADGVPLTAVIASGQFTLATPAKVIVVGLPYNCDLQTVPLSYAVGYVAGQGMEQKEVISSLRLRVVKTMGLSLGPDFSTLQDFRPDEGETGLRSRIVDGFGDFTWREDNKVCVRQSLPLPATISAMAVNFSEGN